MPDPIFVGLKEFGARFEAYRLSRNIPQDELARKAGVSRSTIVRIENGKGGTLDTVLRLLRALEIGERLFHLVPDAQLNPADPLAGKRQRAAGRDDAPHEPWSWGDEE